MATYRQVFGNNDTRVPIGRGAGLRSASGVNQCDHPTSVLSFVGGELHELTPDYIRNAPADRFAGALRHRLVAVRLHLLNVEFLKSNELVFIHQFARFLVSEIVAPIRSSFVGMTKGFDDLALLCAPFGKLFFLALQAGNVGSVLLHPALASNLVAIAEIGKGRQTQVNADNVGRMLQRLGFTFTGEKSVPVTNRIALNGQSLDVGTDGTVELDRNIANFGKCQSIAHKLEPRLLKGERIIQALALKAGVARFFTVLDTTKERLERQVYPLLHVLQDLGALKATDRFQDWLGGFPLREKLVGIVQAQRLLLLFVGIFTNCQRVIIDPTAKLKYPFKACSLRRCGKKAVLVGGCPLGAHRCIVAYLLPPVNSVNPFSLELYPAWVQAAPLHPHRLRRELSRTLKQGALRAESIGKRSAASCSLIASRFNRNVKT
jgi:hypothetical protein